MTTAILIEYLVKSLPNSVNDFTREHLQKFFLASQIARSKMDIGCSIHKIQNVFY